MVFQRKRTSRNEKILFIFFFLILVIMLLKPMINHYYETKHMEIATSASVLQEKEKRLKEIEAILSNISAHQTMAEISMGQQDAFTPYFQKTPFIIMEEKIQNLRMKKANLKQLIQQQEEKIQSLTAELETYKTDKIEHSAKMRESNMQPAN